MFTNKWLTRLVVVIVFFLVGCKNQPARIFNTTPQRVISLSPHITEIIFALEQQNKLVAVSDFCSFPPQVKNMERIGGLLNPNLEKILLLKPDVLIGTPSHASLAQKLAAYDIKSILLPNDSLNDLFLTIDSLGHFFQCTLKAQAVIKSIKDSLTFYTKQSRLLLNHAPKAALIIGRDPGTVRHLTVVGPHTFLDSIWVLSGGKNVFDDLKIKYTQVGQESFLTRQPEIIIEFKFNEKWNAQKARLNLLEWQDLHNVLAVRHKQIYVLTGNYTLIPGPRIYLLAKDFYHILQRFTQTQSSSSR